MAKNRAEMINYSLQNLLDIYSIARHNKTLFKYNMFLSTHKLIRNKFLQKRQKAVLKITRTHLDLLEDLSDV